MGLLQGAVPPWSYASWGIIPHIALLYTICQTVKLPRIAFLVALEGWTASPWPMA